MLSVKSKSRLKITTWNINSVRKRSDLIKHFIQEFSPDILLLQETKVSNELFPYCFFKDLGYSFAHYDGEKTGYNGVAILAPTALSPTTRGISFQEPFAVPTPPSLSATEPAPPPWLVMCWCAPSATTTTTL